MTSYLSAISSFFLDFNNLQIKQEPVNNLSSKEIKKEKRKNDL